MKKILATIFLLMFFLIPAQITFGDTTITDNETANIPIIKGKASRKPQQISIADFNYTLQGDISSASLELKWGTKNRGMPLWNLSHLDLYLDDILLMDFGRYFKSLRWRDRVALRRSLRKGGMIDFNLNINPADFDSLKDGAQLYLVGKPKFFKGVRLDDITLTIVDPVSNDGSGTQLNDIILTIVDPLPNDGPGTQPDGDPGTLPNGDTGILPGGSLVTLLDEGTGILPDVSSVASVPEPVTMILLGFGLIGLAVYGRKRFFKK